MRGPWESRDRSAGRFVRGVRIDPDADAQAQLARALAQPGPCLIDIPIEQAANVYPMVPPGAANRQMITQPETTHA